jgi:hypothetical protein
VFEEFARDHRVHPLCVTFMLANTFFKYLETAPAWVRVKGQRGEIALTGEPYSDTSRAERAVVGIIVLRLSRQGQRRRREEPVRRRATPRCSIRTTRRPW